MKGVWWSYRRGTSKVWYIQIDCVTLLIWYALLRRKRHGDAARNRRKVTRQRHAERQFKEQQREEAHR